MPTDTAQTEPQCTRCHQRPAGAGGVLCDDCYTEIAATL